MSEVNRGRGNSGSYGNYSNYGSYRNATSSSGIDRSYSHRVSSINNRSNGSSRGYASSNYVSSGNRSYANSNYASSNRNYASSGDRRYTSSDRSYADSNYAGSSYSNGGYRENDEPVRVYAPSNGQLAYDVSYKTNAEYSSARLAAQPSRKVEPSPIAPKPRRAPKPKKQHVSLPEFLRANHVYSRVCACMLVAALACAAIFTLLGYEAITNAQKELNSINKQIEQTEKMLDEINMNYLFSLDVSAAQAAAEAAGMTQASAIAPVNP